MVKTKKTDKKGPSNQKEEDLLSLKKTIEKKKKKKKIQVKKDLEKKIKPLIESKRDEEDSVDDEPKSKKKKKLEKSDGKENEVNDKKRKKKLLSAAKRAEENKRARLSIATGELANCEAERKRKQDLRTLYIRFKDHFPSSDEEIRAIHPKIKNVRVPRQAKVRKKTQIKYAFVEFGSSEEAGAAKRELDGRSDEFYVDFVGQNSKNQKTNKNKDQSSSSKRPINPVRLFVNGIGPEVTAETLKELFPKCKSADIPVKRENSKKSSIFGFVDFYSPSDAKAAFDAAQDLSVDGHNITVLYARLPKTTSKKKKKIKKKQEEESKNQDSEEEHIKKNDDDKGSENNDVDSGDDDCEEDDDLGSENENDEESSE